jgi:hypothetical protein
MGGSGGCRQARIEGVHARGWLRRWAGWRAAPRAVLGCQRRRTAAASRPEHHLQHVCKAAPAAALHPLARAAAARPARRPPTPPAAPAGAGKTTLMDVIAGRKTVGEVRGEIFANGRLVEARSWSRVMGYVEQSDVHSGGQTVAEALWTSARLRLPPSVGDAQVGALLQGGSPCSCPPGGKGGGGRGCWPHQGCGGSGAAHGAGAAARKGGRTRWLEAWRAAGLVPALWRWPCGAGPVWVLLAPPARLPARPPLLPSPAPTTPPCTAFPRYLLPHTHTRPPHTPHPPRRAPTWRRWRPWWTWCASATRWWAHRAARA